MTAANRLREAGFEVRIVSIGSTPTMTHAEDETGVTEIRAGVYALGDLFMMNLGRRADGPHCRHGALYRHRPPARKRAR